MRLARLSRKIVTAVVLLAATAAVAGVAYLKSPAAGRRVSGELTTMLGAPVRVDHLGAGLSSTDFDKLELFETGPDAPAEPWVTAAKASLDASVASLARGGMPRDVTLTDAKVRLRFGDDGNLLTGLPKPAAGAGGGPVPTLKIVNGTVTFRQPNRPESTFTGINATLTPDGASFVLAGTVDDPAWGPWTAEGRYDGDAKSVRVQFKTRAPKAVTPELLRKVPFVRSAVWDQVSLAGTTPAAVTVEAGGAAGDGVHYQVDLAPTDTTVTIPASEITARAASGTVVIKDNLITLTGVSTQVAGGSAKFDGVLDFRGDDDNLYFNGVLHKLDTHLLPKGLPIPAAVAGKVGGRLELNLKLLAGGGVRPSGRGNLSVVADRPGSDPVDLVVKPSKKGLDVVPENPMALTAKWTKKAAAGAAVQMAARFLKPGWVPKDEKAYLHLNLALKDVNLVALLKGAGIVTPVGLDGKVSVVGDVDVPTAEPDDLTAYRLTAEVTSRRLMLDRLGVATPAGQGRPARRRDDRDGVLRRGAGQGGGGGRHPDRVRRTPRDGRLSVHGHGRSPRHRRGPAPPTRPAPADPAGRFRQRLGQGDAGRHVHPGHADEQGDGRVRQGAGRADPGRGGDVRVRPERRAGRADRHRGQDLRRRRDRVGDRAARRRRVRLREVDPQGRGPGCGKQGAAVGRRRQGRGEGVRHGGVDRAGDDARRGGPSWRPSTCRPRGSSSRASRRRRSRPRPRSRGGPSSSR